MSDLRVAVIGTGSWGTTLAVLLAQRGLAVTLWARTAEEADHLEHARENTDFVPGLHFPAGLYVTSSLERALERCGLLLLVVPAQTMRENVRNLRPLLSPATILLSCSKGLEINSMRRMTVVILEEAGQAFQDRFAVLSGPHLFREIANGLPAAGVVAASNPQIARFVQETMMLPRFRLYRHEDVIGVELGGALKNVIAIAAGAVDGFGFGDNAKATILTRGLAEMTRLAVAAGANPMTMAGLAGMGDLIATCASPHSRNHQVGGRLAHGERIGDILGSMKMVAEGVPTAQAALQMAQSLGVELPITEQVHAVVAQGKDPRAAVMDLMTRAAKHELD